MKLAIKTFAKDRSTASCCFQDAIALFTQGTLWQLKPNLMRLDQFQTSSPSTTTGDQRFVLIIDEINRGNIAGIFGELITLIERDKRAGSAEPAKVRLPYSKELDFCVPPNLYILGTMNTADRSVEALDTALRRRFSFVEMPSRPEILKSEGAVIELDQLLASINDRIERLLDKDHHIGHSYFMGINDTKDPEQSLRLVFKNKVLPLLQEYFYGDPRKLGAVLGHAWVKPADKASVKGLVKGFDLDDAEKDVFIIADPMNEEIVPLSAFTSIYA